VLAQLLNNMNKPNDALCVASVVASQQAPQQAVVLKDRHRKIFFRISQHELPVNQI
jgi:hypothetical protein